MIHAKLGLLALVIISLMTAFVACSAEEIDAKKKEAELKAREKVGEGFQAQLDKLNVKDLISQAKGKGGAELMGLASQATSKFGDIEGLLKKFMSGEGAMSAIKDQLTEKIPSLKAVLEQIQNALKK